jgi:hypothetical protein
MQYLYMESVVDLGFDPYQVKPDFRSRLSEEAANTHSKVWLDLIGVKP